MQECLSTANRCPTCKDCRHAYPVRDCAGYIRCPSVQHLQFKVRAACPDYMSLTTLSRQNAAK